MGETIQYLKDRDEIAESAFYLPSSYLELDQFIEHCFSDPSICTNGLSLSLYVNVKKVLSGYDTLLRLALHLNYSLSRTNTVL